MNRTSDAGTGTGSERSATGRSITERANLAANPVNRTEPDATARRPNASSSSVCARCCRRTSPSFRTCAGCSATTGYVREGEADVVIGDPDRGILVIEVKAGEIRRDADGDLVGRPNRLPASPVRAGGRQPPLAGPQAPRAARLAAGLNPIAGQAVAFPDVELDSMRGRLGLLGPDVDVGPDRRPVDVRRHRRRAGASSRGFVDRAFEVWSGEAGTRPPGRAAIDLLVATMTEPFEITPMLRNEIAGGEREVVRLTEDQFDLLNTLRSMRRAVDRRRRRDRQDDARRREGAPARARGLPDAARLLQLAAGGDARRGGRGRRRRDRPARGQDVPPAVRGPRARGGRAAATARAGAARTWWDETLPRALDEAIAQARPALPRDRRRRGPGLRPTTGSSRSRALLFDGREDVLYVFHDPAQAIYRDDVVARARAARVSRSTMNCRNAQPIHDVVAAVRRGGARRRGAPDRRPRARADRGGRRPRRRSGRCATRAPSAAGRRGRQALGHRGAHRRAARGLGRLGTCRAAGSATRSWAIPRSTTRATTSAWPRTSSRSCPSDVILCDTIRRFKGLERPVIVLVELPEDDADELDRLLYVGASRARCPLLARRVTDGVSGGRGRGSSHRRGNMSTAARSEPSLRLL